MAAVMNHPTTYQTSFHPQADPLLGFESDFDYDEDEQTPRNHSTFDRILKIKNNYKTSALLVGILGLTLILCLVISMASNSTTFSSKTLPEVNGSGAAGIVSANSKIISISDTSICDAPGYSKSTLKLAQESPMISLFRDSHENKKFEASDIISVHSAYFVVYDNLYSIGRIGFDLPFNSERNVLLGNKTGDSGYEAIVYDEKSNLFYVVVEAVKTEISSAKDQKFHAEIQEIEMIDATNEAQATLRTKALVSYKPVRTCAAEFEFSSGNKGFEGAIGLRVNNQFFLIGLCEGNHCQGGKKGREAGNGRVVVMKKVNREGEDCAWKTVRELDLPETANFVDYSAIAIKPLPGRDYQYRVAVSSQESSQVWLSEFTVSEDLTASDWSFAAGTKVDFPRSDSCEIVYCNIEGIAFYEGNDNMLVAVSDKMKANNKQPFRCLPKDQSIHLFVLP
jgi:hypothetical protein